MTRTRHQMGRVRGLLLLAGLLYCAGAFVWLFAPLLPDFLDSSNFAPVGILSTPFCSEDTDEQTYAITSALFIGCILLAQWAFLRPGKGWTAQLSTQGRPLKSSIVVAGAMASLLTIGAFALVMELFSNSWTDFRESAGGHRMIWGFMLLAWMVWGGVFLVYWRQGDRYTQFGRMIRALVAGSVLEALVAIPVHLSATRQQQCYCMRGTYTTLIFAGTVVLWAFGPGLILLFWRERYRRNKLFPMCEICGYDLRGSDDRCPECGTAISPRRGGDQEEVTGSIH